MSATAVRIEATHGVQLRLLEWSREGTALLLLHGFDNDAHVWDGLAPLLAPYYRTLALDHRGHGKSGWDPEGRYDHETLSLDVEAVLDRLEIKRAVLIGHSLGGRIAMRFARRNPERMAGLVIVDCGPELDARGVTRIQLDVRSTEPSFDSVEAFHRVLAHRYPEAHPATLERLAGHWLRQRPDGRFEPRTDPAFMRGRGSSGGKARVAAEDETALLWDALRRTPCPTLVVRGAASDILDPDTAERMCEEALPDGRLVVIPRAGHSVMLDNPAAFQDAVCGFVLGDG